MVWYNLSSLKTQVRPPPSPHIAPPIPMDPRVMHQTDVNTPDGISQQHVTSSRSVTKHQFVHSFSVCEPLLPQIQGHFVEKTMQAVNMTSSAGMGLSTDINIESLLDAPLTRLGLRRRDLQLPTFGQALMSSGHSPGMGEELAELLRPSKFC